LQRIAARAAWWNDDGIAQLCEREKVASVERQLHDLLVLDHVADLGVACLKQRRAGRDPDFLDRSTDVEREVERDRLAQLHQHAGTNHPAEARELDADDVHADP
jgi:hypothetical protein